MFKARRQGQRLFSAGGQLSNKARRQGQPLFLKGDLKQVISTCWFHGLTLLHFGYPDLCLTTRTQQTTGDKLNSQLHLRFINLLLSVVYLKLNQQLSLCGLTLLHCT